MKNSHSSLLLLLAFILGCSIVTPGQSASRPKGAPANAKTTSQQDIEFDRAVKLADEARLAGRLDDAIVSYNNAMRMRPRWPDGWWYLGAILYEKDLFAPEEDLQAFFLKCMHPDIPVHSIIRLQELLR